ncbi:MAG TPA: TetR/AcrR family transcriptional regulator [Devosia sp.]|jgi:AcrR family transcriptional regulator|uniref:TetR/AcrR family transcriptional regulator n=1 Tax=Devosia sp. TaxID=1871048 RepID=UPI002DDD0768|nr:TetR/AcrR family transcriptional regulator [Devosia sp.]HEV2514716.1 TetR/AcrR family transcriptional regulator [Devosia sp.]
MTTPKRTDRSRAQILAAADQAFRELGFADTSMEAIAMRAGLTRKTLYNLFSSKDEIALTLIARVEAGDTGYRVRLAANEAALSLLAAVLLDSAGWCLANPSLARLALSPAERPSVTPPERPSFQGLVRDILVLGQRQGVIRSDENPDFMALLLLGIYGQAMLTTLATGRFNDGDIRRIVRLVVEGIGTQAA